MHTHRRTQIGAYLTTRNYGGSEEGGWWYESLEHLGSELHDGTRASRDRAAARLRVEHEGQAYGDWRQGGAKVVYLSEAAPGSEAMACRPQYS